MSNRIPGTVGYETARAERAEAKCDALAAANARLEGERDAARRLYEETQKLADYWADKHNAAITARDAAMALAEELRAEVGRMREAGTFLLARLNEWMSDNLTDDGAMDWFGHVVPATGRLRAALAQPAPAAASKVMREARTEAQEKGAALLTSLKGWRPTP